MPTLDVVYDEEHQLSLDIHRAESPRQAPLLVYVHGGGFEVGDKSQHAAARLVALSRLGFNVASIDYRLAPQARYPAPIDDVAEAIRFLSAHADRLDIAAARMGLLGASAGGYLAAMAALRPDSPVRAVCTFFSPFDLLVSSRRSPLENRLGGPLLYEANLVGSVENVAALRSVSATRQQLAAAPPFLLVHGDRDVLIHSRQSDLMHAALVRSGVESSLMTLGGAGHDDPAWHEPGVLEPVAAWFHHHLGPANA